MNHTSKRALQFAAMILVGATFFIGGCGPENLDTYVADTGSELANDAADKTDAPAKPAMDDDKNMSDDAGGAGDASAASATDDANPTGAMASVPAVTPAVAPTRVVQLPPAFVKLPSEFRAQPPIVTHSGEQIGFQRNVLHQRDIHVAQPAIEKHLITKNVHTHNQFQTRVFNHPSFRKDIAFAHTASVSSEVLPTTVVTTPTVVGPIGVAGPIYPGRPFCSPLYSGGLLRNCGGYPYPYLR
jgi:hypothetical protein